ncbi:MAG: ribosome small subunit-dependent GTPase A [Spirochaetales bacterium]|nr:ribosome small subunit-dependent GTPase A [Spirochaetales bacterium]
MNIEDYGWNTYRAAVKKKDTQLPDDEGLAPGRVVTESGHYYKVRTDGGENWAVLTGSLLNSFTGRTEYPAVGDWLFVDPDAGHEHWIIRKVLARHSALLRKTAGRTTDAQVLAANIDYVFIVNGLDGGRNFNLRGIERYLTIAWDSGAQPAVILNKADLCDDVSATVLQAQAVAPGVPVLAVSAATGAGFEELKTLAPPGRTIVLTGGSGVGKSSIINRLAGEEIMYTGQQRQQDLRGKHTTTRRQLVRLTSGALLIDTPGLREIALWTDAGGLSSAFPEIDELTVSCRFRDCTHSGEPGCAVLEAVTSGKIERSRYENYLSMQRELEYLNSRRDEKSRLEYDRELKARGKELSRYVKDIKKHGKRRF